MGLAVRRGELPSPAKVRSAILELVSRVLKALNAVVEGDGEGDIGSNRRSTLEAQPAGQVGAHPARQVHEDVPLGPGLLGPPPGNLRAEDDAPLRARFCNTTRRFVARRGGKDDYCLAGIKEHLGTRHNVHVDAQWDASHRLAHIRWIWQDLQAAPPASTDTVYT